MDSNLSLQSVSVTHEILNLIVEVEEFKRQWEALKTLSPERLLSLRHVATIESIGSSTRIEGVKLSDREIETLLADKKLFYDSMKLHLCGWHRVKQFPYQEPWPWPPRRFTTWRPLVKKWKRRR